MAKHDMSIEQVKSTCKSLEVSPSKSSASSPIYGGGGKAQAKGGKAISSKLSKAKAKKGH